MEDALNELLETEAKKLTRTAKYERSEMYLSGVSVRRVEDITEALWGGKISPCHHQRPGRRLWRSPKN